MILLGFLIWCFVGSFSGGMAFTLNDEKVDPIGMGLMTAFAPVTVVYVIVFLSMKLGIKLVNSFKK